eukprot:CAMPEP_0175137648 /NCGR_PEP_ID=MMETSP0087-20121206/9926_1 /TAXON_ID=136419 /ORGANISM="Unknown Unknown, Strain D1" /LENGTH=638 /DNA_ID=CAMNT_0016420495 /DNA_START=55 /DNA_END=1971 /DNA_ORIENTATION=-
MAAKGSDSESIDHNLKQKQLEYYTYALEQKKLRSRCNLGVFRTPSYWSKFLPSLVLGIVVIGALISRDALKEDVRELSNQLEDMRKQAKEVQVLFDEQRWQFMAFKQNATTEMQSVFDGLQKHMAQATTEMQKQQQETDDTIKELQTQIKGSLVEVQQVVSNATQQADALSSKVQGDVDQLEQQVTALQGDTALQEAQAAYNKTLALKKRVQEKTDEAKEVYREIQQFNATYQTQIQTAADSIEQKIDQFNSTSTSLIHMVNDNLRAQVNFTCTTMLERPEKLPLSFLATCAAFLPVLREACETNRLYRDGFPLRDIFQHCTGERAAGIIAPCAEGATIGQNLTSLTSLCPKELICPYQPNCTSNYLYAVGGYNQRDKALSVVERFNGTSWTTVGSMNTRRANPLVVVYQGYLYALGGYDYSTKVSSVERFDGTSWTTVASMKTGRASQASSSAVVYKGYLYAVGGGVERFNGTSWAAVDSTKNPKIQTAQYAIIYQGCLTLFVYSSQTTSWDMLRFDGTSWDTMAFSTPPGNMAFNVVYLGHLYNVYRDAIYRFNGVSWDVLARADLSNYKGFDTAAVVYQGQLQNAGGYTSSSSGSTYYYNTVRSFNGTSWTTSSVAGMRVYRSNVALAVFNMSGG